MNSLDFYAKIEPLLGFYEEYDKLYSLYIKKLHALKEKPKTLLDIGSGNGYLLKRLMDEGFDAEGIERSSKMVQRAKKLGLKATKKELSEFDNGSFEAALAVGDVLNYMDKKELKEFFSALAKVLQKGGYFLADVNTLMGFELADGVMCSENEKQFLTVEASFENKELKTDFTLFEKKGELYEKSFCSITQFHHSLEYFKELEEFELLDMTPVSMFSDEDEKALMLFQKRVI